MQIGSYRLSSPVLLAPMAGVTNRPFRRLCCAYGAGLATSERVIADPALGSSRKPRQRLDQRSEPRPRSVQIAGAEPTQLADAARFNGDRGADLIDINRGCPAKKVCRKAAGSALRQDESRVARLLEAVAGAVAVPVTLKIRTGWDPAHRNGVRIARIAEAAGIQAVAVHGRTRACGYTGPVEYETIRAIKQAVRVPVSANGAIQTPEQAVAVQAATGADAVMAGRGAPGRPWVFRGLAAAWAGRPPDPEPDPEERFSLIGTHLDALYRFYGADAGVRIARKQPLWYAESAARPPAVRADSTAAEMVTEQQRVVGRVFAPVPEGRTIGRRSCGLAGDARSIRGGCDGSQVRLLDIRRS